MRILKILLILIVVLVALVAGLWITGPATSVVERSTLIAAEPSTIYPMVSNLRNTHEWGPWKDMDLDQKNTWEGEDGTVGSIQRWEGDTVGKGYQEITGLVPDSRVTSKLVFTEPWESASDVAIDLEPQEGGTKVRWSMASENKGLFKLMARFMDMDAMIGPDFERGLANLKAKAEAEQVRVDDIASRTFRGYLIEEVDFPETVYIGKRATVRFQDMEQHIGTTYATVGRAIGMARLDMSGSPSILYFEWDEENKRTDMMPAFPVRAAADTKLPRLDTHVVPASRMLKLVHQGPYDALYQAHGALDDMIAARGLEHYGNVVEVYEAGPPAVEDPAQYVTIVYYMVR